MREDLANRLRSTRARLGISQQDLAAAAGVARQTIGGIEAGHYAPSAAVALKLARALGCHVEELFWLEGADAEIAAAPAEGTQIDGVTRVALARPGGRWIAHPLEGDQAFREEMIPADGIARASAGGEWRVTLLDDAEMLARTVLLAGCTPALSLWARSAERWQPGMRIGWIFANSRDGLARLARGEVHAAGLHLCDPLSGECNAPYVRQALGERRAVLVCMGAWEEGLMVRHDNPKSIRSAGDLPQDGVTIVNREPGSGSRLLLETLLAEAGVPHDRVRGFDRIATSHVSVARRVASGDADAGPGVEAVARAYGLGFLPMRTVRYDLALLEAYLELDTVQQLLDTLGHRWVCSQLRALGGYDTSLTGERTLVAAP